MAECYYCKKKIHRYGGWYDGGCDQLKKDPLPIALDGICECFEMVDCDTANMLERYDEAHRTELRRWLEETVRKRNQYKKFGR